MTVGIPQSYPFILLFLWFRPGFVGIFLPIPTQTKRDKSCQHLPWIGRKKGELWPLGEILERAMKDGSLLRKSGGLTSMLLSFLGHGFCKIAPLKPTAHYLPNSSAAQLVKMGWIQWSIYLSIGGRDQNWAKRVWNLVQVFIRCPKENRYCGYLSQNVCFTPAAKSWQTTIRQYSQQKHRGNHPPMVPESHLKMFRFARPEGNVQQSTGTWGDDTDSPAN